MRQVHRDARVSVERILLDASDDANHREPWPGRSCANQSHTPAKRRPIRPQLLRHELVDDRHPLRRRGIVIVEQPPVPERNLHRLEISSRHHAQIGIDEPFPGRRSPVLHRNRSPGKHLTQRQRRHRAGSAHARHRVEPPREFARGVDDDRRARVAAAVQSDFERQNVARVESRRGVLHCREAANKQPCAGQQHERERELHGNERAPPTLASPQGAAGRAAAVVGQSVHVHTPDAPGGDHSEQGRRNHRHR